MAGGRFCSGPEVEEKDMRILVCVVALAAMVATAQAGPFEFVRIGDVDGFGYGTGTGFVAAGPGNANVDGVGVLAAGDFLPDINNGGSTLTGGGDDFDLRSAAEIAGGSFQTGGSVTVASVLGSNFTDISLSTSYDVSSAAGNVLIGTSPNVFGSGGAFPTPPSATRPNQPGFYFDFTVAASDIDLTGDVYFNMVFGDYDVIPASVQITDYLGNVTNVAVNTQAGAEDGLIQAAPATLGFGTVFEDIGGGFLRARLNVDFVAGNEPYTAFDYVELSVTPISTQPPVPEPASLLLCLAGVGGLALWRRRKQA